MNSRIYSGKVMHCRTTPIHHQWTFPFYFYAIDLDELEQLNHSVRGFSINKGKLVSLRNDDYLRGKGPLREQLKEWVDLEEVDRIILITVARFIRKVFNPVSFYYCLRKDGSPACVVAEVNNTFGERHLYRLDGNQPFPLHGRHDKQFHVSPFNSMDGHYEFTFSAPVDPLRIGIKLIRNGQTVLEAAMWGRGTELTTASLWKTLLRYPFTAAKTMPRIVWQAALLHYKKKLPVFKRPPARSPMTIITKPVK